MTDHYGGTFIIDNTIIRLNIYYIHVTFPTVQATRVDTLFSLILFIMLTTMLRPTFQWAHSLSREEMDLEIRYYVVFSS